MKKKGGGKRYQIDTELHLKWHYGFSYNAILWRGISLCRIYPNRIVRYEEAIKQFDKWFWEASMVKVKGNYYRKSVTMDDLLYLEVLGIIDSDGIRIKVISNEEQGQMGYISICFWRCSGSNLW
jgi:hypothetical protein